MEQKKVEPEQNKLCRMRNGWCRDCESSTYAPGCELKPEQSDNVWHLSRERMPDYDGVYLVAGWLYHECGNVTPFFKVTEVKMNQWVKQDIGEQMTYWRELDLHPDTDAHNRPSRLMFPF